MESTWKTELTYGAGLSESGLRRRTSTEILRIVCLWMLLMRVLHAEVPAQDKQEEICKWETFRANCSEGRVIFINSARYGRIRSGNCAQMEANERPCYIDVLSYVDKQCGGRRSCDITLPNKDLDMMKSSCSKELNQYLEISYHCQEVYSASDQSCIANQSVPVVTPVGYLANLITDETNKGSSLCPWKIQLQLGQTVHLTLLDFGVYRNVTMPDKGTICHIYAVLKDSFASNDGPGNLVCGGDARETLLLTSTAREVQISTKKLNNHTRDPIYFLIKYEVIGCPEFVKPEGADVEIISSGLRVTCSDPRLGMWEVRCLNGKWEPSVNNNCAKSFPGKSSDAPPDSSMHQGILIVIVIAVAIVISAIIIVVGICLLHKKKIFSPGEGLLDSPTFDKHGIVYHTPMLSKRYLIPEGDRPMTDIERNYATTLQMRQMVLPSAVMQSECIPSPGGDIWMCPVHGIRTAGIATGNGSLSRRNMSSFKPRMEHIYEVPTFEVEVNQETKSSEVANLTPESPFYHQLDPEGSKEVGRDLDSSSPPASTEPPCPQ